MGRMTARLRETEGSALIEFAISLPLLVVFIVGIYDFSGAFNQKQKIEHAAQEGAVVAGAQPMSDIDPSNGNPQSLQPVLSVILNSLANDNVLTQANQGTCTVAGASVTNSGLDWTYKISGCPDQLTVSINRGWVAPQQPPGPPYTVGTRVKVVYPYHWRFNSAIQLLFPGAGYAATTDLNETATVHNQL